MANYFLHMKIFGRGKGSKVTKAAAYRAGERIHDERTSALYNYTSRTDVAHAEIVLPTEYADRVDMEWALDRSTLWNAAEHAGRQWNSRLAREILVHVPGLEHLRQGRRGYDRRELRELADPPLLGQRARRDVAIRLKTHWSAGSRAHHTVKDSPPWGMDGVHDDE